MRTPLFLIVSAASVAAVCLPVSAWASADTQSPFPRWSQFPTAPQDVAKPAEYARRVKVQQRVSADLQRQVRALEWDSQDPETLSATVRSLIDPVLSQSVDSLLTASEINAFANDLRSRVNPPAQIDSLDDIPTLKVN